jgi:hypothetical protein
VTLADRAALVELGRPVAGSNPVVHPSRDAWGRIIISRAPLGDPAKEIDRQQDQNDDDEDSYDGHLDSFGWDYLGLREEGRRRG